MKRIKNKNFGLFKVADSVIENIEQNHLSNDKVGDFNKLFKKYKNQLFLGINPEDKTLFHFIPFEIDKRAYSSMFPDPIVLYYSLGYHYSRNVAVLKRNIAQYFGRENDNKFSFINQNTYNAYLQNRISTIVFMHASTEAFINYSIPDGFIYKQEYEGKTNDKFFRNTREFNKEQIERYILFREKLREVVKQAVNVDLEKDYKQIYDTLVNLNDLRNDIIHLRSVKKENEIHFFKVFKKILDEDLDKYVSTVKDFINIVNPGHIEFEDFELNPDSKSTYNFQNYTAVKLDISLFIKIIEDPNKFITLIIPKSDDREYKFTIEWLVNNLNQLAEKDYIYIPTVKDELNDKIEIEITRFDK